MRISAKCLAILAVLLVPGPLFAQAVLTGTVHDASGAVLPGVTVEAASPALIETRFICGREAVRRPAPSRSAKRTTTAT